MPLANRDLAMALVRALGVPEPENIRRLALTLEPGQPAIVTVERVLPKAFGLSRLERLQLRAELPARELQTLAAGEPDAAGSDTEATHAAG